MKKLEIAKFIILAVQDGWYVGSNHKEGCSIVRFHDGMYSYSAGWNGGQLNKSCRNVDEFTTFLIENAFLHELESCIEGYLGHRGLRALSNRDWEEAQKYFEKAKQCSLQVSDTGMLLLHALREQYDKGRAILESIKEQIRQHGIHFSSDGYFAQFFDRAMSSEVHRYSDEYYQTMVSYWDAILYFDLRLASVLFWRGWAYEQLHKPEEAIRDYTDALPLFRFPHEDFLKERTENRLRDLLAAKTSI